MGAKSLVDNARGGIVSGKTLSSTWRDIRQCAEDMQGSGGVGGTQ